MPWRATFSRSIRSAAAKGGFPGGSATGCRNGFSALGRESGFTLIEVLVVLALTTALFGLGAGVGGNFYNNQTLISERDNIVGMLRNARNRAMDNANQTSHGVYIGAGGYTEFDGASYASRNTDYDATFPRYPKVTITGPSEIVFAAMEGISNVSGTISVSSGAGTVGISINNEGRISW